MMAVQLSDDSISKSARRQQIIDGLHDIPGQIKKVLDQDAHYQALAKDMSGEKSLLIMGRGYQCKYGGDDESGAGADESRRYVPRGRAQDQGGVVYALGGCELWRGIVVRPG